MITTLCIDHPATAGRITIRGEPAPLSWDHDLHAKDVDGKHVFTFELAEGEWVELKPLLDGKKFARGHNYTIGAGETLRISPYFERNRGHVVPAPISLHSTTLGATITARVWLPPSYEERTLERYPVVYVLDGHAALTDALPGEDSWRLDEMLDGLIELRTIEEPIVVAIHTDEDRLTRLSPVADAELAGGQGPLFRDFVIDTLVPHVDATYRTRAGREGRLVLGASMGGLFAFYTVWTRSDVFGKAACLSPSFWWGGRAMVREAERAVCPVPRPWLYFDSGAAQSPLERDARLRDGWADTSALRDALVGHCYEPGKDLHVLAFPGATHDSASWAARLAIPLQLLLPRND